METSEEYDATELERIVARALGDVVESDARLLFSFGETRLLQELTAVLPKYVQHHGDVAVILDELRARLYEGIGGQAQPTTALRQLHTVVSHCRACPAMQPSPYLPHWNLVDPDVVFVFDVPLEQQGAANETFITALKEVGFRSGRIAATSVTRCAPQEHRMPAGEEVAECSTRYLFTELQLLKPKLIVACGRFAASVLLGHDVKVTQEQGQILWVGPWPIAITTSPGYAARTTNNYRAFLADVQKAFAFTYG